MSDIKGHVPSHDNCFFQKPLSAKAQGPFLFSTPAVARSKNQGQMDVPRFLAS